MNTSIFRNPTELMENICNVTAFLRTKIEVEGGDPDWETLTVIQTVDGKDCYTAENGAVYRVYKFIGGTKTIENDKTLADLKEAGKGFGCFAVCLRTSR